jgi:bifunctional DNA-binding transcriptional regulator/antitoxin component of YhaV-PrlF toxin-antitoxin module
MKIIAKTKITNSSLTTVPKAVKLFLNLRNGDSLEWVVNNDNIMVKRVGKHGKK